MPVSNYDLTRDRVRGVFLQYDQEKMIRKFSLQCDGRYLYLTMLRRAYRIGRSDGVIEWSDDGFLHSAEADFGAALTICDVLCDSKDGCALSGQYRSLATIKGLVRASSPGMELYQHAADRFSGHLDALRAACSRFGAPIALPGDAAFRLEAFPFLPVVLQFWDADDEFPASLNFLFDDNMLDFMRFETIFYLMSHILSRLYEAARL